MDQSFESRVWQKALDRGLLSSHQINDCLKDHDSTAPTLRMTEVLVARGFLKPEQILEIRGELAGAEPAAPTRCAPRRGTPRS